MNMDLIKQEEKLQKEAKEVLNKLDLIKLLSKYGQPEIVGSLALGLMTWRDIDLEIICEKLDRNFITEIATYLIKQPSRRVDLTIADNSDQFSSSGPKSLYIGFKYFGDELEPNEIYGSNPKAWKIDMHFLLIDDVRAIKKTKELDSKLTEQTREIILKIKNILASNPGYRKEITSLDIYTAVLDYNVKNITNFKSYLKNIGKKL